MGSGFEIKKKGIYENSSLQRLCVEFNGRYVLHLYNITTGQSAASARKSGRVRSAASTLLLHNGILLFHPQEYWIFTPA